MDWRTSNRQTQEPSASRGGGPRGAGRGRGKGGGRGGRGASAPRRGSSTKPPNTFHEKPGQSLNSVSNLGGQFPVDAASPRVPQLRESGTASSPQRKGRDKLPSMELKPSNHFPSGPTTRNTNHANNTPPTLPSGTRPRNYRRRSNKLSQKPLKEPSPQNDTSSGMSPQASELRSNIDTLVERVRAMAMANSGSNKCKDGEPASQVHETHFDWAEDDGDTLSDLGDDWTVPNPRNGPIKENLPVEQDPDPAIINPDSSQPVSAILNALGDILASNQEQPGHLGDKVSETVGDSYAENLPADNIQNTASQDASTVIPPESLLFSSKTGAELSPSPSESSDPESPSLAIPSVHLPSIQLSAGTKDEYSEVPKVIVNVNVEEIASGSDVIVGVVEPNTVSHRRAIDATSESPGETFDNSSSRFHNRNTLFRNHSRVSSPARRAERDPLRPRSEFGSPERNHRRSKFHDSLHSKTNSTPQALPSRVHATRPIITPGALSIISKTLRAKDPSSSRT